MVHVPKAGSFFSLFEYVLLLLFRISEFQGWEEVGTALGVYALGGICGYLHTPGVCLLESAAVCRSKQTIQGYP